MAIRKETKAQTEVWNEVEQHWERSYAEQFAEETASVIGNDQLTGFFAGTGAPFLVKILNLVTPLSSYFLNKLGLSGGQVVNGGLDSGDDLELHSTAHATKGNIIIGDIITVDEENDTLDVVGDISVVGNTGLTGTLDVTGIITGDGVCAEFYSEGASIVNPTTINILNSDGTLISGTVTDVATINQTYYQLQEVTGTPGFDIEVIFVLTDNPGKLTIVGRYQGLVNHDVVVEAWNYDTTAWVRFTAVAQDLPHSTTDNSYQFDYSDLTGAIADYISGTASKIRISHTTSGVATHNLYLDYVDIQMQQVSIPTPGTFVTITGFTEGESNNVTVSGANGTMTVVKAGKYLINVNASFSGTDNILFTGHIFKDGTQVDNIGATRKLGSAGDIGSVSFSGILSLVADEVLTLQITSDMVAYFAVEHINWNISRLN